MSSRLLAAVIVVVLGSAACASADNVPTEIESADPVPTTTDVDTGAGLSEGESDGDTADGDTGDGDGRCTADEAPDGGIYFVVDIEADDPDGGLIVRAFGSPTAPERAVLENGTEVQTFIEGFDDEDEASCVVLDGGSVWWQVAHSSLAAGGWVNSRFLDETFPLDAFAEAFVAAVMDGDDATITRLSEPEIADAFIGTGGFTTENGHGVESIEITSDTDFSFSWGPTLTASCEVTGGVVSSCLFGE